MDKYSKTEDAEKKIEIIPFNPCRYRVPTRRHTLETVEENPKTLVNNKTSDK